MNERLLRLRARMDHYGMAAYLVPTADYHGSEYVGAYFKAREWLTGFTGSAGTLLLIGDAAYLWTDTRYFLQAEAQLAGQGVTLMRIGEAGVPDIPDFLTAYMPHGGALGLDGRTVSAAFAKKLNTALSETESNLNYEYDLVDEIWEDRPPLSMEPVWELPLEYAGESAAEKLGWLRARMAENAAELCVLTALDEIAWLFNIRGNDVCYNPVALCYAFIEMDRVVLCIDEEKLSPPVYQTFERLDVELRPYIGAYGFAHRYQEGVTVMLSEDTVNFALHEILREKTIVLDVPEPIALRKAIKNEREMAHMRECHVRDGLAMVRFLHYLKTQIDKAEITEISAAARLESERRAVGALDLSFETICAYGPHAAIVHHVATPETSAVLRPEGLLLIDSGAQYMAGTTDVTRTVALGPLSPAEKRDFALVLRGMLALQNACFPEGCDGKRLDLCARMPLWEAGLDYGHGTGHGVGALLNVHEGPQSFRWNKKGFSCPIQIGMVTSDEPGLYVPGSHGVRLENLIACKPYKSTEYGAFLCFAPLTLVPIDLDALDPTLLSDRERGQLNAYHRLVYETLAPRLETEAEVRAWLEGATREI